MFLIKPYIIKQINEDKGILLNKSIPKRPHGRSLCTRSARARFHVLSAADFTESQSPAPLREPKDGKKVVNVGSHWLNGGGEGLFLRWCTLDVAPGRWR